MKWLRLQVALLAIAISVASAQCIVTCAAQPCHESSINQTPPCHRHHSPKQQDGPQRCQHPFFLAEGRGRIVMNLTSAVETPQLPMARVDMPSLTNAAKLEIVEASPPGSPQPDFSTVLRV